MFYRKLAEAHSAFASRVERIDSLSVQANDQHNHRDIEGRKVLLILELLIDGQEHIEIRVRQPAANRHCVCWPSPSPGLFASRDQGQVVLQPINGHPITQIDAQIRHNEAA